MLATTVSSLLILGTDSVLAAVPATPVQLAHACLRIGYHVVVPASWGDELVAARAIERAREAAGPVVQCSCPLVGRRLAAHGDAIAPMLMCLVAPPIAVAQYLRALYAPARARITFAGACESGAHESIDRWLTPDELLAELVSHGVTLSQQPTEFDSVLPPDRRRYYSEPGGAPSTRALGQLHTPVELVEVLGDDHIAQIAQRLLSDARVIVDPSVQLGCVCAGVAAGIPAADARARVRELEPPRALAPIVDHAARIALDAELPAQEHQRQEMSARVPATAAAPRTAGAAMTTVAAPFVAESVPRRRSPQGIARPVLGGMPLRRTEGRQLPRAYVARRRSSPRGMRKVAFGGPARDAERPYWPWIAIAGAVMGLLGAWLLGLTR